ncbi:MAG: Bifunctional oligoribonuclease and PAP phosphatase NrnA [Candidatus Cloacimonetes bacterium ADurb.Bin089]|nr:MAG: Bifunctional oligoribonuclease and PAP phosphatase NrnA [Candidatus Cloacimonetes bacterium ADurb.Bin089]
MFTRKMEDIRNKLLKLISSADRIVITTHINPDGDGYCAALALQRIISYLGKNSLLVTDNDDLSRYNYLQDGKSNEKRFDMLKAEDLNFGLAIVLDCNSYNRLGDRRALIDKAQLTVVLDHHEKENNLIPAELSYIEPSFACVGEMLYALFEPEILEMPNSDCLFIGNCLYTTILNDTNNFVNANTDAAVFIFASKLVSLGIKPNEQYRNFFLQHSAEEMRYIGETLATLELHYQRRILTMYSTVAMSKENNIDPESIMNATRWVQGIKGIEVIIYLREEKEGVYKISLRSENVDVNKIAVLYGGGGHKQAAGCYLYGKLEEAKEKLLKDVIKAIAYPKE